MEPSGAPYISASCMISFTRAGFLFQYISIVWGSWGSSMSWSFDATISGFGLASVLLGGTSFSCTSSSWHLLDFLRAVPSSNVTSLLISIWWNPKMYILKDLETSHYPTNIPFFPKGSNLILFSFGMWTYTGQPNILRCLTLGFFPVNVYSGVWIQGNYGILYYVHKLFFLLLHSIYA